MKLTVRRWREFVIGHRLFGLPLGRNGWQLGMILSEDHSTIFVGWFRDAPHSHIED